MCDPISLLSFGLSAAGSVVGFMGQSNQADAQTQEYNQNKAAAERAFADTTGAINTQQEQQQDAAALQIQQNDLKTRAAEATARAGAAAGGIQGISVEEVMGDYAGQESRANAAINQQTKWDVAQGQNEKVAAGDQMASRANSMTPGVQPSPLGAILGIGQAAVSGVTGSMRLSAQNGGTMPSFNFGNFFSPGASLAMGTGSY